MRLHLKISLVTVAILLAVGGMSVYALYAFQRRAAMEQFEHMAQTLTTTILNSLEITMVRNNQEEMREIIRLIQREAMISDVTIYRRTGAVWASGERALPPTGRVADAVACAIANCRQVTIETEAHDLVVITPVENKPACGACHATAPRVLGAIGVSLRMEPIVGRLRRSAALLAALVGFALLFALGMLNLLLGRFVLDPLASLVATVQQVAGGAYQARAPVRRRDELGALARSINEMAERIEHYTAALSTQIGDLTRRLISLGIFGRALTEASDLPAALEEMAHGLRDVLRADVVGVYLADDRGFRLAHRSGEGPLPEAVSPDEGVIGAAAAQDRPVQVPGGVLEGGNGVPRAVLAASLRSKEGVLGVLAAARRASWPFADADGGLMANLAGQMAIYMENVRLFQEVREKEANRAELLSKLITAHEDERRRIARELHDEVSQSLTGLMMAITAAESLPSDALRSRLAAIYATAEATLEEVRKIIHDLRPTMLDDLGLVSAVRVCARNLLEASGIRLTFDASGFGTRRLPAAVESTVFRVAQEAITNIARHARASAAVVVLRLSEGVLVLAVEDNGVGFDPGQVLGGREGRGVGLLGMQERAALVGGRLAIESSPGGGTRIRLTVPLEGSV
ncbi:MAG: histidine kinase [Armatimonadota bacterium]|nr:histidine kinase [Armatimonadota bacterium]MDR7518706.1 histidine kinase [Armatimonadota bacterium]MDR7550038.1 histidine kinase [Armatimonadota bacterium]